MATMANDRVSPGSLDIVRVHIPPLDTFFKVLFGLIYTVFQCAILSFLSLKGYTAEIDKIKILMTNSSLMKVKSIAEHSAILLTCNMRLLVLKTNSWSICEVGSLDIVSVHIIPIGHFFSKLYLTLSTLFDNVPFYGFFPKKAIIKNMCKTATQK